MGSCGLWWLRGGWARGCKVRRRVKCGRWRYGGYGEGADECGSDGGDENRKQGSMVRVKMQRGGTGPMVVGCGMKVKGGEWKVGMRGREREGRYE
ncbi:unnamed protein product [Sphenostylis stenocarpa]|uniref:Uncharacterized protein n=1 Tax=Sphenostylis stenocarpa TaxID=92480 RepID=A0AA86W408_9FABA|nr:unnamed protein product [Sphenostylis stenocarpa]